MKDNWIEGGSVVIGGRRGGLERFPLEMRFVD
jgi:hypothetical protein